MHNVELENVKISQEHLLKLVNNSYPDAKLQVLLVLVNHMVVQYLAEIKNIV